MLLDRDVCSDQFLLESEGQGEVVCGVRPPRSAGNGRSGLAMATVWPRGYKGQSGVRGRGHLGESWGTP